MAIGLPIISRRSVDLHSKAEGVVIGGFAKAPEISLVVFLICPCQRFRNKPAIFLLPSIKKSRCMTSL
jgi:hypothetical protein